VPAVGIEDEDGFKDVEFEPGRPPKSMKGLKGKVSLYNQQGNQDMAERYLLFILEVHERVVGAEHPDTMDILDILASEYAKRQLWVKAERAYARLAKLRRSTSGDGDPATIVAEVNLFTMVVNRAEAEEATRESHMPAEEVEVAVAPPEVDLQPGRPSELERLPQPESLPGAKGGLGANQAVRTEKGRLRHLFKRVWGFISKSKRTR
jgi:hypothetical protein